jgi:hypothetical protein
MQTMEREPYKVLLNGIILSQVIKYQLKNKTLKNQQYQFVFLVRYT